MTTTGLRQRCWGYELSGIEYQLIFEKENMGFVRYADARRGIFYLDPSPFKDDPHTVIYVCEQKPFPPKIKLVEVTVRETETRPIVSNNRVIGSLTTKYVSGWQERSPNELKCNRLMTKDDFLWNFAGPFASERNDIENVTTCMGMYAVSSPQLTDCIPGGVNTVVITRKSKSAGWNAFKKVMGMIPKEFKVPGSQFYYTMLETSTRPTPVNSLEVSRAYNDRRDVPVDLPISFDEKVMPAGAYQDSLRSWNPMALAYILDAHMFQPDIPDTLTKTINLEMQTIMEKVELYRGNLPYRQDLGAIAPVMGSAVARLNFQTEVTAEDIIAGVWNWLDALDTAFKNAASARYMDEAFNLSISASKMLAEIRGMRDTGMPMTIEELKRTVKVDVWAFDEAFTQLRNAGYIYVMSGGKIGAREE